MSNPPAIRRACKEDQQQIGSLWLRLLDEHAAMDPRFGVAGDALERWLNDFRYWLVDEQSRVFVAEHAGVLVGFVTASLWEPPPIYALGEEVYINELYVVAKLRGQGVGRRLFEAVKAWAEALPVERLRLGVLAANTEGRAFWERQQAQPLSLTLTIDLEKSDAPAKVEKKKARLGF